MTWYGEKVMISTRRICGFMPNLHKISWIVPKLCLASANSCNTKDVFEWLNTQVVRIFHPRWIAMVGIWHFNDLFVKLRRRTVKFYYQFSCGILKTVGSKKQEFCPKINILKGNHCILRIRGVPVCQ